jgi:catechol 2,3-dioxygenase-like lactoylglutathione lyase family enzyme
MLQETNAMATIAVKDLEAAGRFYEGTLGLKRADEGEAGERTRPPRSRGSSAIASKRP